MRSCEPCVRSTSKFPQGFSGQRTIFIMKRRLFLLLSLASIAGMLPASPTPPPDPKLSSTKTEKKAGAQISPSALLASANGWQFVKGEWVHPFGYKLVNGRIQRTTARAGKQFPKPPGKLALDNPQLLTPSAAPALENANKATSDKAAADKAAERARNLAPRPAPQTGSHLF